METEDLRMELLQLGKMWATQLTAQYSIAGIGMLLPEMEIHWWMRASSSFAPVTQWSRNG